VDRVHGPVDHWSDFGSQSTVHHEQEQWPELAGAQLAGVPVCGTLPRQRGKQEEGMGISTPIGMRRQRGSDGRATVDRGGGRSSSMRGRSRCRGEERRGVAGSVWRGRDGGVFYRGGEEVVGRGDGQPSGGRRCAIKAPDTRSGDDGATTIHGEIEEESVVRRFSSIRVRKGVHQRRAEQRRQPRVEGWPLAGGGT
jgi:hypothetical protein